MNRQLIMPVSAAAIGCLLAVGVFAATRQARAAFQERFEAYEVEVEEAVRMQVDGQDSRVIIRSGDVNVDGESLREIMENVRVELRAAIDGDPDLTAEERARVREALQELQGRLPFKLDLDADIEVDGERIQIRSSASGTEDAFVFQMDVDGPDLKAVVEAEGSAEAPPAPAAPGGN